MTVLLWLARTRRECFLGEDGGSFTYRCRDLQIRNQDKDTFCIEATNMAGGEEDDPRYKRTLG